MLSTIEATLLISLLCLSAIANAGMTGGGSSSSQPMPPPSPVCQAQLARPNTCSFTNLICIYPLFNNAAASEALIFNGTTPLILWKYTDAQVDARIQTADQFCSSINQSVSCAGGNRWWCCPSQVNTATSLINPLIGQVAGSGSANVQVTPAQVTLGAYFADYYCLGGGATQLKLYRQCLTQAMRNPTVNDACNRTDQLFLNVNGWTSQDQSNCAGIQQDTADIMGSIDTTCSQAGQPNATQFALDMFQRAFNLMVNYNSQTCPMSYPLGTPPAPDYGNNQFPPPMSNTPPAPDCGNNGIQSIICAGSNLLGGFFGRR